MWARRGWVIREGSGGRAGLCFCAWGTRILLHEAPDAYATPTPHAPPGACCPAICTRSASSLCERACGMSFTCRLQRGC